jgi:hypothetical protein
MISWMSFVGYLEVTYSRQARCEGSSRSAALSKFHLNGDYTWFKHETLIDEAISTKKIRDDRQKYTGDDFSRVCVM